jgi:hypothetical protein
MTSLEIFFSVLCPLLLLACVCFYAGLRYWRCIAEYWRGAYADELGKNKRREHPLAPVIVRAGERNALRFGTGQGRAFLLLLLLALLPMALCAEDTNIVRLTTSTNFTTGAKYLTAEDAIGMLVRPELETNWVSITLKEPRLGGSVGQVEKQLGVVLSNRVMRCEIEGRPFDILISSQPIATCALLIRDVEKLTLSGSLTNWAIPKPMIYYYITNGGGFSIR